MFLISRLPDKVEGTKEVLAEIKMINYCPSHYTPSSPNVKAVNKRTLLPGEYRKKADDICRSENDKNTSRSKRSSGEKTR